MALKKQPPMEKLVGAVASDVDIESELWRIFTFYCVHGDAKEVEHLVVITGCSSCAMFRCWALVNQVEPQRHRSALYTQRNLVGRRDQAGR